MNEREAHKMLTEAGFTKVFSNPHSDYIFYADRKPRRNIQSEPPLYLTIHTETYRHGELKDVFPRIFITHNSYLPKQVVKKYEERNAETVKDALNKYNYMVVMRFCT